MKNRSFIWVFVLVTAPLIFFHGCKEDDEFSDERISEIAGTWTATSATFNGVDVVDEGGSVRLVIQDNGRFTFTIKRPGRDDMVFTGRLGFDEQWLAVEYDTDPGEYEYYDITYDEHNLHIGANSEFDFDGDGSDEYVVFYLDMVR
ncbi:MAG: hypothetical protein ABFS32_19035 [Bacteroidota bacterium]